MRVASYLIICSKNPKTFLKNNSLPSPSPCVNPGKIHFNSYWFFFQHRAGYCLWLLAKKSSWQDNRSSSLEGEATLRAWDAFGVTTQTGCGAEQSTCVFACRGERQRRAGCRRSHAYLREGCPSDSAFNGSSALQDRQRKENPAWYAALFPMPPVCLLMWDLYLLNHWHTWIICA